MTTKVIACGLTIRASAASLGPGTEALVTELLAITRGKKLAVRSRTLVTVRAPATRQFTARRVACGNAAIRWSGSSTHRLFHPRRVRERMATVDAALFERHRPALAWLDHLKSGALDETKETSLHGGFLERIFGDVLGYPTMATAIMGR